MSMELMVKAMKIRVGNPLRKLVLIKLADNASDQGECWPSYQHIADQCEISKRSVMNHIAALCDSGLVKKVTRKGEKGNSSNIYLLHLDGAGDSLGGIRSFRGVNMRDDRFNSLKREFDGAPEDAAGALLSVADMMKAAYFLINTSGYKSEGEMILSIASDYAEYVAETRYRRKFTEDVSHA